MRIFYWCLMLISIGISGQGFTKQDTLLGSNTIYRDFWDVKKYEVEIEPNFEQKSLNGKNRISFEILKTTSKPIFQIDLQSPMKIGQMKANFNIAKIRQEADFIFIETNQNFRKGERYTLEIPFNGQPKIAKTRLGTAAGFSREMSVGIRGFRWQIRVLGQVSGCLSRKCGAMSLMKEPF